jgi:hypothetical protein
MTHDPNQDRGDEKNEFYNKSWLRSTDLKRELKLKMMKQMGVEAPALEIAKSRSRSKPKKR